MQLIERVFNTLSNQVQDDGTLKDFKLKSALEFQYHYSAMIFSSIYCDNLKLASTLINKQNSIQAKVREPSTEFNTLFVLLSLYCFPDRCKSLYGLASLIKHRSTDVLSKHNNNFRAIRFLNYVIEHQLGLRKLSAELIKEKEWLLSIQTDSGFFVDTPASDKAKSNSISHLAYHHKISLMVLIAGVIINDKQLLSKALLGVQAAKRLSYHVEWHFFGRSQNSIFSISLLNAIGTLLNKVVKGGAADCFDINCGLMESLFDKKRGVFWLNRACSNNRVGYDGYMYDVVYNAFSTAITLASRELTKKVTEPIEWDLTSRSQQNIEFFPDIGLLKHTGKLTYCVNISGQLSNSRYKLDSRFSPMTFQYMYEGDNRLLPGIGFYPRSIHRQVGLTRLWYNIYAKVFKLIHYGSLPLFGGNSFKLKGKNTDWLYCTELNINSRLGGSFRLNGKLANRKGDLANVDTVNIEAEFSNSINYIINLESVYDYFTYSIRADQNEGFMLNGSVLSIASIKYIFNSAPHSIRKIFTVSSTGYCQVLLLEFRSISFIKVKIEARVD